MKLTLGYLESIVFPIAWPVGCHILEKFVEFFLPLL